MKKLYKFMHKKHVKSLLSGTVLFKNFKTYRDLPPPIGDKNEGVAQLQIGDYRVNEADGIQPLGPAFQFAKGLENVRVIGHNGAKLVWDLPDVHISCFSYGEFDELAPKMLYTGEEQYDAAVELLDGDLLSQFLLRNGVLREDGRPFKEVFNSTGHRAVLYAGPLIPPITPSDIESCIFRKHFDYSPQHEFRFAATPGCPIAESVFVECKEAHWIFKRVV